MKGLVFGNSHVGAVRRAWDDNSSVDVDFYAIPGGVGPHVKLEAGRIYPNDEKQPRSSIKGVEKRGLDLSRYDFIAFCSLGLGALRQKTPMDRILRQISLAEFTQPQSNETLPVSRAYMYKAVQNAVLGLSGAESLRVVRSVFDGPIVCAPKPIPVLSAMEETHPLRRVYGGHVADFTTWFATAQSKIVNGFAETLGIDAVGYPDPAWVDAGGTPDQYAGRSDDPWHMNPAYGALVVQQVQGWIEGHSTLS